MARQQTELHRLRALGGRLCLDFVNTVENRGGRTPQEFLTSYADLARWGRHAGLITDLVTARLIECAAADGAAAWEALERALELREALHRLFFAVATGHDPETVDLEQLQGVYADALAQASLIRMEERLVWDWRPDGLRLDQVLWAVARSAIELLTTGDLRRIKVCANPDRCGWLFYDSSKNASRRWCSMEGCGSQVKMRRHFAKRRAIATASAVATTE